MRRTLIGLSIVVIAIMAMTATAVLADTNFGIGINKTTKSPASWIASRMEVFNRDMIGMWSSTMGSMPVLFEGLEVVIYGDFTGYRHIRDVYLTAAHGQEKFQWRASKNDKKIKVYQVVLPRLALGAYNLKWRVISRDEVKELDLFLFQINTLSKRETNASNHLLVQRAPANWDALTDQQAYVYTRGLVSAWATPDPAVLAQQQMLNQMSQPQPMPPVQVSPTPPAPIPSSAPIVESSAPVDDDDGVLVEYGATLKLYHSNRNCSSLKFNGSARLKRGDILIFSRDGQEVAEVKIISLDPIAARLLWGRVREGDSISRR